MANFTKNYWDYPFSDYDMIYMESFKDGSKKFYRMVKTSSKGWNAEYGRIGKGHQTKPYTAAEWGEMLEEKLSDAKQYTIKEVTKTNKFTAPAPVVVEEEEEVYTVDNPGGEYDFSIHIEIDRTLDIAIYKWLPRLTQLSIKLKNWNEIDALPDGLANVLFNIRVEYWKTGILTKAQMEELNWLYEQIEINTN